MALSRVPRGVRRRVLDSGVVEWTFGAFSGVINAVLAWPWWRYFWPLLVWQGRPDYSLEPGRP
ncbi:MAG: hypothetical protein ABIP41_06275 [Croceibacterium sp.]